MKKVFVVSISKHCESRVYAAEEDRIVPRMINGVLRIFESKDDAKKYIETFYNESATDNASLSSRDEKKGSYKATLNDWYNEDDKTTTWDGIPLKGCKQKITIKLYSMELTKSGSNADLDDDMYDLLAGEDTDRAIIN
ncbi:hypothetical protein [Leyella stercorea]|uniref:hypothetical protein n=1 Tax=Leyella stercorea TaxID=363265 RepID=UPI00242CBA68|nr:hypothetical protein [Leyella stercorea]